MTRPLLAAIGNPSSTLLNQKVACLLIQILGMQIRGAFGIYEGDAGRVNSFAPTACPSSFNINVLVCFGEALRGQNSVPLQQGLSSSVPIYYNLSQSDTSGLRRRALVDAINNAFGNVKTYQPYCAQCCCRESRTTPRRPPSTGFGYRDVVKNLTPFLYLDVSVRNQLSKKNNSRIQS
ncbi:hypothetical protein GGR57DRAFT_293544 [Xylariaceae sp. FL1272]|nr:hypothetical protein GGR57DRAFT_293544 [Xylariaceae sp. FL1272]